MADLPTGVRQLPSGRYQGRIMIDGTRHVSPPMPTAADAAEWRTVTRARHITGALAAGSVTVAEYSKVWLSLYDDAPTRTRANYEVDLRLRIVPAIGTMKVRDVRPTHIKRLLQAVRRRQSVGVEEHTYRTLSALFRAAEQDDLTTSSPVRSRRHRPRRQHDNRLQVWTRPQARRVLMQMGGYQQDAATLQLAFGARIGEIAGLTPVDIDLEAGLVDIARGVTDNRVRATKNHTRRHVTIPKFARSALERLVSKCVDPTPLPDLAGREWDGRQWDWRWLITTSTGRPVSRHTLNPALANAAEAAGVPVLSSHGLRHTAVSWWIDDGASLAKVAQVIGDTVAVTERTYMHMVEGGTQFAADTMDRALGDLGDLG